jgi:hypothetical protein
LQSRAHCHSRIVTEWLNNRPTSVLSNGWGTVQISAPLKCLGMGEEPADRHQLQEHRGVEEGDHQAVRDEDE